MNQMDYKGKRILILEGYARQCLPFMEAFRKAGCEVTLLCGSKLDLGYWSRYPNHKIVGICDPDRYEESEKYICELIKRGQYDLVLPLVDFSARILSENKEELSQYAVIASNDKDVFEIAQDKLSVMRICMENGIPCPLTIADVSKAEDAKQLRFPIVVKPRNGCGAKGFHRFDNYEEFERFAETVTLGDWVIQEYIEQTNSNMSVSLFIDNNGTVKSEYTYVSRRWFPLNGGTGTLNELVDRPDAVATCKKLASLIGLRGNVGFDLIDDPKDGVPKVIEINPRTLACEKIGFAAGVDRAKMVLEKEFGGEVAVQKTKNKKLYIRMTQTDVLWFLKSPDRFRAKPSWFRIWNTRDQTFSWFDPAPWFAFLVRGLKKLDNELVARNVKIGRGTHRD